MWVAWVEGVRTADTLRYAQVVKAREAAVAGTRTSRMGADRGTHREGRDTVGTVPAEAYSSARTAVEAGA